MASDLPPFKADENTLSIRVLRCLNVCFSRIYHHVEVRTPCRLPRRGAGIIVCNHISGVDPVLIQAVSPRLIRWMMAREYYAQPGLKWLLDRVGIIPVDRSGRDLAATRAALEALKNGYIVGIFPEGRIEPTRELLPFLNGIVLLAAKSGAPIYPAYLDGTQRGKEMPRAQIEPQRARLSFGEPFHLTRARSGREHISEATAMIQNSVEKLRIAEVERSRIEHYY
jgi:1-acyl-sn-glycerol-3-phosphate acyltransferase